MPKLSNENFKISGKLFCCKGSIRKLGAHTIYEWINANKILILKNTNKCRIVKKLFSQVIKTTDNMFCRIDQLLIIADKIYFRTGNE